MKEVERLRSEPIPEQEFMDKKRSLVASFALSLETPAAILGNYVTSRRYNLPADYWDKYPGRIMAVTREQVQAAAKKYLAPGRSRSWRSATRRRSVPAEEVRDRGGLRHGGEAEGPVDIVKGRIPYEDVILTPEWFRARPGNHSGSRFDGRRRRTKGKTHADTAPVPG